MRTKDELIQVIREKSKSFPEYAEIAQQMEQDVEKYYSMAAECQRPIAMLSLMVERLIDYIARYPHSANAILTIGQDLTFLALGKMQAKILDEKQAEVDIDQVVGTSKKYTVH